MPIYKVHAKVKKSGWEGELRYLTRTPPDKVRLQWELIAQEHDLRSIELNIEPLGFIGGLLALLGVRR